jgi:hypothetical protein
MLQGFAALAAALTGLGAPNTVHAHMPAKMLDPLKKGRLEFRVIACRPVNSTSDEIREVFDAGTNKLLVTSFGRRYLTIQVKFIGDDQLPSQDALFYLERLGDRLTWPSSTATLRGLDMGLVTRGSFLDLSQVMSAEDRQNSVGVKDFIFAALVSEEMTATGDSPASWIETLYFGSDTLDDVDGTPLVPQISEVVTRT